VIKESAQLVANGELSLCESAARSSIAKSTLWHYVNKLKNANHDNPVQFFPKYACRQVFDKNEETMLVEYLIMASKLHHGLSTKAGRFLAFEFGEANKKTVPISWIYNQTAGEDWLRVFFLTHRSLAL